MMPISATSADSQPLPNGPIAGSGARGPEGEKLVQAIADLSGLADPAIAAAIGDLIVEAPDSRLIRINPLAFARASGFDERQSVAAFLHATQLGLFELAWDVVCAGCGGVLHSADSLKAIEHDHYSCRLCSIDCRPGLDEAVEISFTVHRRIRRIEAHAPEQLTAWTYARQMFFSSGSLLPDTLSEVMGALTLEALEIAPGGQAVVEVDLPEGPAVLFDPVSHSAHPLDVHGAVDLEPQERMIRISGSPRREEPLCLAPGPVRLRIENAGQRKALPFLWIGGQKLRAILSQRGQVLSARQLLSHQTFRDIYRTDVVDTHQRFEITNLTFMFTDLKGSTELYEAIGDLAAFDLVRAHFRIAQEIIAREGGAVVKTIGDAVMATFLDPAEAMAAALAIRDAVSALRGREGDPSLVLKIGLHTGPCLAVSLNQQQDYFGQTVNIAARVQGLAEPDRINATAAVLADPAVGRLIAAHGSALSTAEVTLRGTRRETRIHVIER